MLATQKQRKYSSVDYEDVHVTVYGSTAIATGVYKGKGAGAAKRSTKWNAGLTPG